MKLRRIYSQLRAMFGRPDDLKRPTFETDSRLEDLRRELYEQLAAAGVQPKGVRRAQQPVDYERLPV